MTTKLPEKGWLIKAMSILEQDEGRRSQPYKDSLGFWTIGVGHLIGKDIYKLQLSERVVDEMLIEDMEVAWAVVCNIFGEDVARSWCEARQLALLSLAFNLGQNKLSQFQKTIAAIRANEWESAATHLQNSLWAKQVKSRAVRICFMVRTGAIHADYPIGS